MFSMNAFSCFYYANKQETFISFRVQRYDDILKVVAQSTLRVCDDYVTERSYVLRMCYKEVEKNPVRTPWVPTGLVKPYSYYLKSESDLYLWLDEDIFQHEEADSSTDGTFQGSRNGIHHHRADTGSGEDDEDETFDENSRECHLPGIAHGEEGGDTSSHLRFQFVLSRVKTELLLQHVVKN